MLIHKLTDALFKIFTLKIIILTECLKRMFLPDEKRSSEHLTTPLRQEKHR